MSAATVADRRPQVSPAVRALPARRAARRSAVQRNAFRLAGLVVIVCSLFPVYWMVSTSLLPNNLIRNATPTFAPTHPTLTNYRTVLRGHTQFPFLDAVRVSLSVTVATVVVALVVGLLAALAVTRFSFVGRRAFVVVILVIQMLPGEALIISMFRLLDGWHLTNTVLGLSAVYVAAVLPFTIWTLRGFVAGIPVELEEAAMIDGCSRLRSFRSVTLPLIGPGLIATGVFAFIQAWNEFVMALVLMNRPDHLTLPVWLRSFKQVNSGTDWGAIMAGSTLMTIPVIVFFLFVQGRMTSGLVSGAVKG
jgi:N,N'-diacetylchitobiose transport system permease protein